MNERTKNYFEVIRMESEAIVQAFKRLTGVIGVIEKILEKEEDKPKEESWLGKWVVRDYLNTKHEGCVGKVTEDNGNCLVVHYIDGGVSSPAKSDCRIIKPPSDLLGCGEK